MGSVRGFQAVGHAGIAAVFWGKDGKARPFLEVIRKGGNEGQAGLLRRFAVGIEAQGLPAAGNRVYVLIVVFGDGYGGDKLRGDVVLHDVYFL